MIKFLKVSTIIIVVLLLVATIVLVMLQSLITLVAVPTSILFGYYLMVLFLISILKKQPSNQILALIVWVLFLTPLLWLLIDPYSLSELLMPKMNIDMK
ncbi:hypothetical protein FEZ18_12170 [Oceanihabitans sp. IOP_32]|uniref:hypothetical protein n=1 Tax=Oceanihabitans sp. IOP_32 TaxID=2529032 RepID=UPI0012937335|nr:hypothetical protein [Oceanihabitans sp. IOP_32]QFZ55503.1 hypothetical protein FEZ18_12170 [Oceanihabitans sp. IOP_32]